MPPYARRRSRPGGPARVFVFAGFGDHCEQVPAPQIAVTQAPAKGDLSFVQDQETTIQYSAQGTCIGQTAKGTGIYYTARAGQDGVDRFSVSAKLSTGETARGPSRCGSRSRSCRRRAR